MGDALIVGFGYGLAAGIAPGPLLALVVSSTLTGGRTAGFSVALAPLITDAPIVIGAVVAGSAIAPDVLAWVGVVGALFVIWLGVEQIRSHAEAPGAPVRVGRAGVAVRRAALTNVLSPHPYLFWAAVGAPLIARFRDDSGATAVALFLAAFYLLLVATKMALALGVDMSRRILSSRGYRIALTATGTLLVALGVLLGVDSVGHLLAR